MKIAILTFDGFNEIDSFVALNILNRVNLPGWKAQIVCQNETAVSMNGVVVQAQQRLAFVQDADAVLFGSGRRTRQLVEDAALMQQLRLQPSRQLIGSQCSGALFLHRLGLLEAQPVCTDNASRPFLETEGLEILAKHFHVRGNIATAGGCLAAPCLAAWVIRRLADRTKAIDALRYVAPVGSEDAFIENILLAIVGAEPNNALQPTRENARG